MLCGVGSDATVAKTGTIEDIDLRFGDSEFTFNGVVNYSYNAGPESLIFDISTITQDGEILPFAFGMDNTGTNFLINDRTSVTPFPLPSPQLMML